MTADDPRVAAIEGRDFQSDEQMFAFADAADREAGIIRVDTNDEALVERLCEVQHDAYEAAAAGHGWRTQQKSHKPWADVPEANRATMRDSVRAVLAALREEDMP